MINRFINNANSTPHARRVAFISNIYRILEILMSLYIEIDLRHPFFTGLQHLKMEVYEQAACTNFGVSTSTCGSESHGRAATESTPDLV